jgi:hypothetical protein
LPSDQRLGNHHDSTVPELAASIFVSYTHRDGDIARGVAARLTELGHRVWIDEGELRLGDSLVDAISGAIAQVDFLVAFVSPGSVESNWCQKEISLAMTGEIGRKGITVIPVRLENVMMPSTLADKLYLDAAGKSSEGIADELNRDFQRHLTPRASLPPRRQRQASSRQPGSPDEPIRLIGIDEAGITRPRNDGTAGSALYTVPFILSRRPDAAWSELMVQNWNRPPSFTTMHRPGNGRVTGDRFVLSGTTIEEVEKYHLETLQLALNETNRQYQEAVAHQKREQERQEAENAIHDATVRETLGRLGSRFTN